jgi:hypothetical protein
MTPPQAAWPEWMVEVDWGAQVVLPAALVTARPPAALVTVRSLGVLVEEMAELD